MNNIAPEKKIWLDADNNILPITVEEWVLNVSQKHDYKLFIGTDSHIEGRKFRFATVVCLYEEGKGGNYVINKTYEDRLNFKGQPAARMFREVEYSIQMANFLFEKTGMIPEIHIDASPEDANEFTSSFSKNLVGYATGFGFKACIKPDSWVATTISDKYTK